MWPYRRPSQPLTPVREESLSAASASTHSKTAPSTPIRGVSIEMERVRSFISNIINARSQTGQNVNNDTILASLDSARRARYTGDGNDDRRQASSLFIGQGESSTAMASPVIGDFDRVVEKEKFKKHRNYVFAAAAMTSALEGYATMFPVILTLFLGISSDWHKTQTVVTQPFDLPFQIRTPMKISHFVGLAFGTVISAFLFKKYDVRYPVLGFLGLVFFGNLATLMTSWVGDVQQIYITLDVWRFITGIGIGVCRSINAPTATRVTTPKWRGSRLGYICSNVVIGYLSVLFAGLCSIWFFNRKFIDPKTCTETCQKAIDNTWRILSGGLLLSTATSVIARRKAFNSAPPPGNSFRAFAPPFKRFAKAYRSGRYLYPLIYICVMQFFAWASFFAILMNTIPILWEVGLIALPGKNKDMPGYLYWTIICMIILVVAGAGTGCLLLCLFAECGRKRILLLTNSLLIPTTIVLAGLWEPLGKWGRLVLVLFTTTLLFFGPVGCGYIYATEAFPRMYRAWGSMIADVVGSVGAIVGITIADVLLSPPGHPYPDKFNPSRAPGAIKGIRVLWCFLAGCCVLGFLAAFGIVETARKEIDVIEGEIYGDWGKWDDRRRMRPEQGMMEENRSEQ